MQNNKENTMPTMIVAAWGNLAPLVAEIILHAPELSPKLMYASPAIFHAYGAYLRLLAPTMVSIVALAQQLLRPPEALLKDVFPESSVDDLLAAFALVDDSIVLSARSYLRLDKALRSPAREALLSGRPITLGLLSQVERLAPLDPLVSAARKLLAHNPDIAPRLHAAIILLRSANILGDAELARKQLQKIDDMDGFKAFMLSRLAHANAPPCSISLGPDYRLIQSVPDLRGVVGRLKPANFMCLTAEFGLIRGSVHFVELCGAERGLAALWREAFGIITIGECYGEYGKPISDQIRLDLMSKLNEIGVPACNISITAALEDVFEEDIYR